MKRNMPVLVSAGVVLTLLTVSAMGLVCICAEKRADNTEMFSFLLSRVCSASRHLTTPHQGGDWRYTRNWGGNTAGTVDLD